MSFDIKYPAEIVTLTFPYAKELNGATITPASAVVAYTVTKGTDPTDVRNGAAQISGSDVLQSMKLGLDGCSYHFVCQVDLSDGRRLLRSGTVQVKNP